MYATYAILFYMHLIMQVAIRKSCNVKDFAWGQYNGCMSSINQEVTYTTH